MINKENKLRPCTCGGEVEIIQLSYPRDTYDIKCSRCGNIWHFNTYVLNEAIEMWRRRTSNSDAARIIKGV